MYHVWDIGMLTEEAEEEVEPAEAETDVKQYPAATAQDNKKAGFFL